MSLTIFRRAKIISLSVFLLGAATVGIAYSLAYARKPKPLPGFTMFSKQTLTLAESGETQLRGNIERYQKSDGSWALVNTYYLPDGTIYNRDKGFGQLGRGVFRVNEKSKLLSFLSPMSSKPNELSEDDVIAGLRKDPHFVREEDVMGYKTYVLRYPDAADPGYVENYLAPALHGLVIKSVSVMSIGVEVIEPVRIIPGEPSESVFGGMPDYPVNYEHFEKKIEATEKAGKREVAEEMRRQLQQRRSGKQ